MKNVGMTIGAMVVILSVANIASADTFDAGGANEFTIDFVNISGDASSANGTNISRYSSGDSRYRTFSDPDDDYRMGTYEITDDQWSKFVNSYGTVTGSPSIAYDEGFFGTGTNVPTKDTSWYEAAQFANYLNTSTGHQAAYKFTGTQGTGNYTYALWESGDTGYDSSNPYRNSSAYYFLPTEDEWVKAAYWNGTVLQRYANASPGDLISGVPDPAKWNYVSSADTRRWNVGSGSKELNGTFDMMGNHFEWMESPRYSGEDVSTAIRSARGGSFNNLVNWLRSNNRTGYDPYDEHGVVGFRVASVPEPCSLVLLSLGGLMLRRRRAAL